MEPMIAPKLKAYRKGVLYIVWCRYCTRYHTHGAASDGHRLAHCLTLDVYNTFYPRRRMKFESPYLKTGYELVDAGPAPDWMTQDARRKYPRGPDSRPGKENGQ